jgi:hypothetical protein
MKLDLTGLEAAVGVVRIRVANLQVENAALRESADPTAQTRINAIVADVQTITDSITPIPDPGQPA